MNVENELERFSAGESFAVNPDAIERELASLWREAGKTTDGKNPVTRACLWNVAFHLEERPARDGFGHADHLLELVNELPKHLAARALVLRTLPDGGKPELESWISANCILAEGGSKLVCSEEITFAAHGPADRHLPGLVRALLVPAVPTAAVFAGAPPSSSTSAMAAVAKQADRIITDVDRSIAERPLAAVRDAIDRAPLMAMDLGWLANGSLRAVIAELFDAPLTLESIGGIARVRYLAPATRRWSSLTMLGWIAAALGVTSGPAQGGSSWSLPVSSGGELALSFEVADTVGPRIEFYARGRSAPIVVDAVAPKVVEVPTPAGSVARKSIQHPEGAALLARALATRSDDQGFAGAMFIAGDL